MSKRRLSSVVGWPVAHFVCWLKLGKRRAWTTAFAGMTKDKANDIRGQTTDIRGQTTISVVILHVVLLHVTLVGVPPRLTISRVRREIVVCPMLFRDIYLMAAGAVIAGVGFLK